MERGTGVRLFFAERKTHRMRHSQSLMFVLAMGAILTLSACSGSTTTSQLCFSQVPVTNVQSAGNNVNFTVTFAGGKTSTFSVQKDAFGGAPASLKDGDVASFCAN